MNIKGWIANKKATTLLCTSPANPLRDSRFKYYDPDFYSGNVVYCRII